MEKLRAQREAYLLQGNRGRAMTVLEAVTFESCVGSLHLWSAIVQHLLYHVGTSADRLRVVCREIFLEHYPTSLAIASSAECKKSRWAKICTQVLKRMVLRPVWDRQRHCMSSPGGEDTLRRYLKICLTSTYRQHAACTPFRDLRDIHEIKHCNLI
eukprot:6191168-Pleurochrysis_carterae.AAC.1